MQLITLNKLDYPENLASFRALNMENASYPNEAKQLYCLLASRRNPTKKTGAKWANQFIPICLTLKPCFP